MRLESSPPLLEYKPVGRAKMTCMIAIVSGAQQRNGDEKVQVVEASLSLYSTIPSEKVARGREEDVRSEWIVESKLQHKY